jgi:hypothetical protein
MRTSTTVQPGQRGAKKFVAQYGDRLVCVRYRSDEQRQKRFKTIELIVEEWPWRSPSLRRTKGSIVLVRVAVQEIEIRRQVKGAGGVWNPDKQAWEVRYDVVVALGVTDRIMEDARC